MSPPTPQPPALLHTAFYKFTRLAEPEQVAARLRQLLAQPGDGLTGSSLVATEGINGMLAGGLDAVDRIENALLHDSDFAGAFIGMAFKRSACVTKPFGKLKVHVKKEIVPLGIEGVDARVTGIDVSPLEWRELIRQPDVVLLDNRNSFEPGCGPLPRLPGLCRGAPRRMAGQDGRDVLHRRHPVREDQRVDARHGHARLPA